VSVESLPKELDSKYVILEKMGEGGMGAVYKVRHRFFDEIQVLKFMQAKFQESEELRSRFLQEARTAKKVRHRNIAEVIDYSVTSDGTAFIVMEFVDGVNLREVLKRTGGPIDHALVVEIAIQTLAALAELHRHGFVHRDVAPDNLLLSRDPQGQPLIKVIDLGIAKAIENSTQDLTKTGRFMGKMQYASPEQFGGIDGHARVDQRSDLYSFGAVLYELLTGLRLVTSSDYRAVIAAHLYRPPRPFEETDPNNRVPKPLRDVVLRALEKDPNDRYQNADEFSAALKRASGQAATTTAERPFENRTEEDVWRTAEQQNSVRGWELFLESYPDSPRARDAQGKLEELEKLEESDWEKASADDSADAWHAYLKVHGESPRASRARRRLDRLTEAGEQQAYEAATADKSIESFEKFLSSYPRSRRASEIRDELDRLREEAAEENDFGNAAGVDTTGAWRTFLKKHSRSGKADAARQRLETARKREDEEADWQRAQNAQTREAWQQFLQIHPDSKYAQEARNALSSATAEELESADWDSAMRVNSSAAWNSFIERHPKSKQAAQAWTNFAAAKDREESKGKEISAKREVETDDRAFEEAVEMDSADTWELFIDQHRDSPHLPEARERLKKATAEREASDAWKRTIEVNTAEAYESFAKKFTASRHTQEAETRAKEARTKVESVQQQREQRDWANAESLATPDAWREYLRVHPTSARTNTAQKNLEAAMRRVREEADWAAAIGRGDLASVERFLQEHPTSHRTQAAKDRIEMLKAQVAKTTVGELEKVQPTGAKPTTTPPAKKAKAKQQPEVDESIPSTTVEPLPGFQAHQFPDRPEAKPSPMKWIIAAVAVLVIGIGGWLALRSKPATGPGTGPAQPPPAAIGQLVINALPWGEVKSIKDTQGIERLKKKPTYTPTIIPLPPGTYTIELSNPNSGKTVTRNAIVTNGTSAQVQVELDTIDADEYLKKITKK
jgi:serine/threonine protein kinase